MKQQKQFSTLNGKHSLLEAVVDLTKQGLEIDTNASCCIGTASYVLVYEDGKSEQDFKEEYKKELKEKKDKEEQRQEEQAKKDLGEPDFEKAKGFTSKDDLIEYASTWDIELDKRKTFEKMVQSFRGKWYASK